MFWVPGVSDIALEYDTIVPGNFKTKIPLVRVNLAGGTPPYYYRLHGAGETGLEINNGVVFITSHASNQSAGKRITAEVNDSAVPPVTLRAVFTAHNILHQPIGKLMGNRPQSHQNISEAILNGGTLLAAALKAPTELLTIAVNISAALANSLVKSAGNLAYTESNKSIAIPAGTAPNGQTLSLVLSGGDNNANNIENFRVDRLFTVYVKFIPGVSAVLNTELGDVIRQEITIKHYGNASVFVARVSASAGLGNYVYQAVRDSNQQLKISDQGIIFIPPELQPAPSPGRKIIYGLEVNDRGNNAIFTPAFTISLTLNYVLGTPLGLQAKNSEGLINSSGDFLNNTLYIFNEMLSESRITAALTANITAAIVTATGGISPYEYKIYGANSNLTLNTGRILLTAGYLLSKQPTIESITIGVTDNGPAVSSLTVKIKVQGVARHSALRGNYLSRAIDFNQPIVIGNGSDHANSIIAVNNLRVFHGNNEASSLNVVFGNMSLEGYPGNYRITLPANIKSISRRYYIVLRATDGDNSPEKRLRPDRIYTIFVNHVP